MQQDRGAAERDQDASCLQINAYSKRWNVDRATIHAELPALGMLEHLTTGTIVRVSKGVVQSTPFLPLALAIPALIGLMIGIVQVDHPRALVR